MEIYAKGQLSFLILNCLLERDFYGLDIISEIKIRSNGKIDLKKPSVYSNLTRMEKQGQVSSYMKSSDLGPNRRYYSITEKGRNTYLMLKTEFERNHFNVFQDFSMPTAVNADSFHDVAKNFVTNAEAYLATGKKEDANPIDITSDKLCENNAQVMDDEFFDFSSLAENNGFMKAENVEEINDDTEKPNPPIHAQLSGVDSGSTENLVLQMVQDPNNIENSSANESENLESVEIAINKQDVNIHCDTKYRNDSQKITTDGFKENENVMMAEKKNGLSSETQTMQRSIFEAMKQNDTITSYEEANAKSAIQEQRKDIHNEVSALGQSVNDSTFANAIQDNNYTTLNHNNSFFEQQQKNQMNASASSSQVNHLNINTTENNKNDARFLSKDSNLDSNYNKRIYDITKDMGRYRKKRSFAEDQIAIMIGEEPLQVAQERQQQNIENFKSSLIANKGKFSEPIEETQFNRYRIKETAQEKKEESLQTHNDGVFIQHRVDEKDALKPRKIEPPRLKIIADPKEGLPAPKRDTTIDPSHKEIISRLYSKSKGSENELVDDSEALYDYEDLQDYYQSQKIGFKPYERDSAVAKHNTNKLNLITSITTFFLLSLVSGVLYAILANLGFTSDNTNFLFILLPCLYFIDVCIKWYSAVHYTSWEPKPMLAQWILWLITMLAIGAVVGLNFIFGMEASDFMKFATTFILPISLLLVLLPIRYYIKRVSYIKFWK